MPIDSLLLLRLLFPLMVICLSFVNLFTFADIQATDTTTTDLLLDVIGALEEELQGIITF